MKSFTKKSLSILALSLTSTVAFGSFVGCSGDDDDNNTGTDAGGTDASRTDATSPVTDAGKSDTGTGDAAGDAAPVDAGPQYIRTGTVSLTQTQTSAATYSTSAFASFSEILAGTTSPNCTTTAVNTSCTLQICTVPVAVDAGADAGVTDAGITELPQASTITLTDSKSAFPGTVALTPDTTTGAYSVFSAQSKYFAAADSILFSAAGGTVGAFTTTVAAPADLTATTPARSALTFAFPAFSRGVDLAASWTGAAQGSTVTVFLQSSPKPATGASKTLTCKFDGFGNSGTVPSVGGLAQLDDVDGTNFTGTLGFTPSTSTTAWGAVDGVDAGETTGATNQDFLVTTTVSGTAVSGTYTNSN